ncbi:MAG: hypothetical protein AAB116_00235 [Candidatus Poribacteria bacterium]
MSKRFSLLILSFVFIFILSSTLILAHEAAWPGKRLAGVFPNAKNFKARQVTLNAEQTASIEKATGTKIGTEEKTPTFYIAYGIDKESKSDKLQSIGAVVFIDAVGERGNMEVNVAISLKGTLYSVSLWKNKESKQLGSNEFLKQFNEKKKPEDPFQIGKDIVAAKGSEKASQAIATAAQKGWFMFREVFGKKEGTEISPASIPQGTSKDKQKDESSDKNTK